MTEFGKLNFAVAFAPQTAFPLDARYYFDSDGKLAGLKHTQGDYYYTTMILELSQNVSDSDFEYPSDYKLTERSELSEDSVASSTSSSTSSN